ncbi:hypothetical protein FRC04_005837 [Tulasnella sp. 424]|nr:hypothetical protein FRC04_005837 [Tulasnella sp. 424]KAG8961667.1 hypothetical protein FRC05_005841 [Tulasnella sp. 425]
MIGGKLRSIIEDISTAQTAPFSISTQPRRGQRVTLQVNFIVRDRSLVGVLNDHIEMQFRDNITSRNFVICRTIRAEVGSREKLERLKPKTEYHKPPPNPAPVIKAEVMETVGEPWEDPFRVTWKTYLPEYRMPNQVFNIVTGKNPKGLIEQIKQTLLPKKFDLKSFGQFWQNLIFLEELQQREHQAVLIPDVSKKRFLFPEWKDVTSVRPCKEVHFSPLSRLIRGNEPRQMAISRILSMGPGSAPFIIHGPHPTALSSGQRHPDPRLRPVNSAVDNIATRLKNLGKSNLLRLDAATRDYETPQSPELKLFQQEFGLLQLDPENDGMRFHLPDLQTLLKFKVVVATCVTAGVPSRLGVKPGHFDWILIDEAGQAAEPEVLIPILTLSDHNTNVVLCGDHHQLGPMIHSPISRALGYSKSYLLRLMELMMYDEKGTMGQENVTIVKYKLPNPNFPIKFHGIVSQDQRGSTSPSYFNSYEVLEVKYIVDEILSSVSMGFKSKDIGIIAPYSAQCSKIRSTLDGHRYQDIKVGSVGEFQGQERPIVIISTTRSSSENGYTGPALDPPWDANEEVDLTVPALYIRRCQQEHAANMEALERRARGTVLRRQGLGAEDRFSDEEDEVVYVSRMEGAGTGWADSI